MSETGGTRAERLEMLSVEIAAAAALLDRPRVGELCETLEAGVRETPDVLSDDGVRRVLDALRRRRWFDLLERSCATLMEAGHDGPRVRRFYAQALIDQTGRLDDAEAFLRALVESTPGGSGENLEARGLLGRTLKQRYVEGGGPGMLRGALEWYYDVYAGEPAKRTERAWHGINAVALLDRARRDRVAVAARYPAAECLAADLLERIRALGAGMDAWAMATGLEACVALRRVEEASLWAHGYAAHPGADAFELGSTLRQLTEVWGLDPTSDLGAAVLPLLRNGLLRREDGFFELSPGEVARVSGATLEKVLGFDYFVTLTRYREGLTCSRAVARIGREGENGHGTGFLLRGRDLYPGWGDGWVVVTNAHVVSPVPLGLDNPPLAPDEAVVTFEALENGEAYRVREVLWTSPPDAYDCSVLSLDRDVRCAEPIAPYLVAPSLPALDGKQRVYIIGHPLGGTLSFSIHDNLLLDYDERRVHYRTPTDRGSSGSPIFNSHWRLVGLHHAGSKELDQLNGKGGRYAANEGIPIQAIRKAVAAHFAAAPPSPAPA